jgi:calnexin
MLSRSLLIALCLAGVLANEPSTTEVERPTFTPTTMKAHFIEQFTDDWQNRWSRSESTKKRDTENIGEKKDGDGPAVYYFDGEWSVEEPTKLAAIKGDKGLVLKSPSKPHALVSKFDTPFDNKDNTLVLQYEVKMQNPIECGGAYIKLLTQQEGKPFVASEFDDKTPYTIMFGPDKCGSTNKVHFIFRHKNPKTGEYEEKHLKSPPVARITRRSTLYTLIVRPDNTFEILINNAKVSSGNLLEDFDPPVNPPKEIDDPTDKKPDDWVDEPRIPDPNATKPDDWDEDAPYEIPDPEAKKPEDWLDDEPLTVPDPAAKKPEDWDDEEDGEWEPPQIPNEKCIEHSGCGEWKPPMIVNPNYKGKWYPPLIDNPAYKGVWKPRKIPNPDYFEDKHPANFEKMAAVGFELWTLQNDILFDNIYIGHSVEDAKRFAEETWEVKDKIEQALEEAEAPKPKKLDDEDEEVSFFKQPIIYLRDRFEKFYTHAQEDFLEALISHPTIVGALVTLAAIGITLFLGIFSILSKAATPAPSSPPKRTTSKTTETTKKENASSADTTQEADASNTTTKKRRNKSRKADD